MLLPLFDMLVLNIVLNIFEALTFVKPVISGLRAFVWATLKNVRDGASVRMSGADGILDQFLLQCHVEVPVTRFLGGTVKASAIS